MPHVTFVAPRFLENTNRYVKAFTELPGVKLSVISDDPDGAIPPALRPHLAGHYRVTNSLDPDALTQAAKALQKGVGPIDRLTGALEQLQLPLAVVRDRLGLPGMGVKIATRFRDKDAMKDVLRANGIPVAKSALVSSLSELTAFIRQVGFPIIVKPQAGLGSRGTHRVESEKDLAALAELGLVPTSGTPLQAEQFVRAREHTCETVSIHGQTVWRSGTRYFPTPLEVLEQPWIQYCVLMPRESDDPTWRRFDPVNEAALKVLFGENPRVSGSCITHMEWFLCDDGSMLVSEVGARPPGVQIMPMMSLAHECDMVAKWAELIAFDRFTPVVKKWACGAAFFRGQGSGDRIVSVEGLDRALAQTKDTLVEARTPKVGMARASGYEGEGWALVRSPTTEGAKQALLTLIQNVQVRYG